MIVASLFCLLTSDAEANVAAADSTRRERRILEGSPALSSGYQVGQSNLANNRRKLKEREKIGQQSRVTTRKGR